jgi:hypothetical protein
MVGTMHRVPADHSENGAIRSANRIETARKQRSEVLAFSDNDAAYQMDGISQGARTNSLRALPTRIHGAKLRRRHAATHTRSALMTSTIHTINWAADIAADIGEATDSIYVTALSCLVPKLTRTDAWAYFWVALAAAASNKLDVRIALAAPTIHQPATIRNGAAATFLRKLGIRTYLLNGPNLLHAKTVTIDSRIAWIGSGNLTAAAACHNYECWMRSDDEATARDARGFSRRIITQATETP